MVDVTDRGSAAPMTAGPSGSGPETTETEREQAHKRVERKRKLRADVAAYVVINVFLIGAWAATGFGYFWPGWVLAGWGMLLVLDAWNVHVRRPVTEEDIDEELGRLR